jgi:hypothetical protein
MYYKTSVQFIQFQPEIVEKTLSKTTIRSSTILIPIIIIIIIIIMPLIIIII